MIQRYLCLTFNISFQNDFYLTIDVSGTFQTSSIFVMFMTLINLQVALSVDRYVAVCHPIKYFVYRASGHKKWVVLGCVVIGIFVGMMSILPCFRDDQLCEKFKFFSLDHEFRIFFAVWAIILATLIVSFNSRTLFQVMKRKRRVMSMID